MSQKILVVDDESAIRDLFALVLQTAGYTVLTADCGKSALETLKSNDIPLMFFDLKMPEMSGIELCRAVKEKNPEAYIIAITGFFNEFKPEDMIEVGFDDYYFKPIQNQVLIDAAKTGFEKLNIE